MAIPKHDELYDYVIGILADGEEYSVQLMDELIIDQLNLTDEEINEKTSDGRSIIKKRLGWSRTYLKKSGLIESKQKGYYNITSLGLDVIEKNHYITTDYLMNFESFREFKSSKHRKSKNKKPSKLKDMKSLWKKYTLNITINSHNCCLKRLKRMIFLFLKI